MATASDTSGTPHTSKETPTLLNKSQETGGEPHGHSKERPACVPAVDMARVTSKDRMEVTSGLSTPVDVEEGLANTMSVSGSSKQ